MSGGVCYDRFVFSFTTRTDGRPMSHMLDCQVSKEGVNESSYEIRYDADTNNLVFYDSTLGSLNPIAEICLNTDAKVKFAGEEFKPVVDGLFLRSIPEKWKFRHGDEVYFWGKGEEGSVILEQMRDVGGSRALTTIGKWYRIITTDKLELYFEFERDVQNMFVVSAAIQIYGLWLGAKDGHSSHRMWYQLTRARPTQHECGPLLARHFGAKPKDPPITPGSPLFAPRSRNPTG